MTTKKISESVLIKELSFRFTISDDTVKRWIRIVVKKPIFLVLHEGKMVSAVSIPTANAFTDEYRAKLNRRVT